MVGYAKLDGAFAHRRDVQDPDSCPVRIKWGPARRGQGGKEGSGIPIEHITVTL